MNRMGSEGVETRDCFCLSTFTPASVQTDTWMGGVGVQRRDMVCACLPGTKVLCEPHGARHWDRVSETPPLPWRRGKESSQVSGDGVDVSCGGGGACV